MPALDERARLPMASFGAKTAMAANPASSRCLKGGLAHPRGQRVGRRRVVMIGQ